MRNKTGEKTRQWAKSMRRLRTADTEARQMAVKAMKREREICEGSFYWFFRFAWDILNPQDPLVDNWHYRILCDELQSCVERIAKGTKKSYDLIISIPPRSGKSTITSIMLPLWTWIKYPGFKFITASYAHKLSVELSTTSRSLFTSPWYQSYWGDKYKLSEDQNTKAFFKTNRGGYRIATASGSTATGQGADMIILDDLLSREESFSDADRLNANTWARGIRTRLNNMEVGMIVHIAQRLHEKDPIGDALEINPERYKRYILPAESITEVQPPELERYYVDGLMFPARFSREWLDEARTLGSYEYSAQYLQQPAPPEGGLFKRINWRFWIPKGANLQPVITKTMEGSHTHFQVELPERFDSKVQAWDLAFDSKEGSDEVAGHVWAARGLDSYLLDRVFKKMNFVESRDAIVDLRDRHPDYTAIIIEEAANGAAMLADLRPIVSNLHPMKTEGKSKEARAVPYVKKQEFGNIYLPHPTLYPWVKEFITYHAQFPKGKDHDIDAAAHAMKYIGNVQRVFNTFSIERNVPDILTVDWSKPKSDFLVGIWLNGIDYYVVYVHHNENNVLSVLHCDKGVGSINSLMALIRTRITALGGPTKFKLFGNKQMFSDGRDLASEFFKHKIWLQPVDYNEVGAIGVVKRFLLQRSMFIKSSCNDLIHEMSGWYIENDKPAGDFYFCRSLLNVVSAISDKILSKEEKQQQKAYGVRSVTTSQNLNVRVPI